jgi:hypothetical protein
LWHSDIPYAVGGAQRTAATPAAMPMFHAMSGLFHGELLEQQNIPLYFSRTRNRQRWLDQLESAVALAPGWQWDHNAIWQPDRDLLRSQG